MVRTSTDVAKQGTARQGHATAHEGREAAPGAVALDQSRTAFPGTSPAPWAVGTKYVSDRERRAARYNLRESLRSVTVVKRLRGCGRNARVGQVTLKHTPETNTAGFGNLMTCGSVWLCPVCSSKIASHRSQELAAVFAAAKAARFRLAMVTLTMEHHRGERLSDLLDVLTGAWHRVTRGRAWKDEHESIGMVGWVRALEVMHGAHGWHPHLHLVVVVRPCTSGRLRAFGNSIVQRWQDGLAALGRGSSDKAQRVDVVPLHDKGDKVAKYVTKLSKEVTMGALKSGHSSASRSPLQVAADFIATGDADDAAVWAEWESSIVGKRALTWSKGLNEFAKRNGIRVVDSDQEVTDEDHGGVLVATFPASTWTAVRARSWLLLDLVELQGPAALFAHLDGLGLGYSKGPDYVDKIGDVVLSPGDGTDEDEPAA